MAVTQEPRRPNLAAVKRAPAADLGERRLRRRGRAESCSSAEQLCDTADLHAGWRVLDVATGSGNAAIAAARLGCRAVGVDYVPSLLERGRQRADGRGPRGGAAGGRRRVAAVPGRRPSTRSRRCSARCSRPTTSRRPPSCSASAAPAAPSPWPAGRRTASSASSSATIERATCRRRPAFSRRCSGAPRPISASCSATGHRLARGRGADLHVQVPRRPSRSSTFFRLWYGPTVKAFAALEEAERDALERDLVALAHRFDRLGTRCARHPGDLHRSGRRQALTPVRVAPRAARRHDDRRSTSDEHDVCKETQRTGARARGAGRHVPLRRLLALAPGRRVRRLHGGDRDRHPQSSPATRRATSSSSGSSRDRPARSRSTWAETAPPTSAFDRSTFTAIDVNAGGGDDEVRIDQSGGSFTDELVTMNGGAGADTLRRRLRRRRRCSAAAVTTSSYGGDGDDQADLGGGDDRFQWEPGDDNDTVDGHGGERPARLQRRQHRRERRRVRERRARAASRATSPTSSWTSTSSASASARSAARTRSSSTTSPARTQRASTSISTRSAAAATASRTP